MYKIIRFRRNGSNRIMRNGLTLEQAQAHCNDTQTSSWTCTTPKGKRTKAMIANHKHNPWFDGYTTDDKS